MASSSRHRLLEIITLLENHHGCTTRARRNSLRLHSSAIVRAPHAAMLAAKIAMLVAFTPETQPPLLHRRGSRVSNKRGALLRRLHRSYRDHHHDSTTRACEPAYVVPATRRSNLEPPTTPAQPSTNTCANLH
ncbi:hypothetical protein DEO72_LG7g1457 [Vigna unguiculata]|uniref:Uncharacterized protein n=1 Tax=Vigna unguiculata TaxID=3917 RepID=A0A4D6MFG4_VIGUN|nr:hypothetical protein DEO72_LG7g1457 [Vigna unguiculata]